MFMVHRRELIEQTSKTFERAGIPHTFVAAGNHYNQRMRVNIASVGTLVNRLEIIRPPKLLIVDEAHHTAANGWATCVKWAKAHGTKIVGLTATPWRLSGEGLREFFDDMVHGPEVAWLIENGFLSKYRAFAPKAPDLTGMHERGGDFVTSEVVEVMSGKAIVSDIVGQWRDKAFGKRTVGFAASVKHSLMMVAEFNANGIPAVHIDANTPSEQRRQYIMNFADGYIPVIWNVDLFGEGFDLSAIAGRDVPIECVIQARPTQSLSLHLQQLGRALRPKPEPAILLDHAGNIMRHGLPDSPFEWSLDAREKKNGGGDGPALATKQCPECFFVHHAALKTCPNCNYNYPIAGRLLEEVEGDLEEVTLAEVSMHQEANSKRRNSRQLELPLNDLIAQARAKGLPPGKAEQWAAKQFTINAARRRGAL